MKKPTAEPEALRVLYVDDYPFDRELVREALEAEAGAFQLTEAASRQEFEARLAEGPYDLVLSDFNILGFDGLAVIDQVRARDPRVPVMIVTGSGTEEVAVEAMKRGAADYVIKTPEHIRRLPHAIRVVLESKQIEEERRQVEEALRESEEKYRTLFKTMEEGVVYQNESGEIISANPAAERILGLTLDQMQGRTSVDPRWRAIHEDGSDFPGETHPAMVALKTGEMVNHVIMGCFVNRFLII